MAFIQCSLTGTALSWYIRLNDTYKQDWHAFVQAFKKQFSSQKNAYYAQVEALNLSKKDNETVRHFALKVQQLVEKGWCNENASTINLKCNEIFTKGLPKNLKEFANKRKVKHTSTVLEPSIPFHTLVKLVDAEDIANDKIRTHDLALEVNTLTKQLYTQTLEPSSQEQLMFTLDYDMTQTNAIHGLTVRHTDLHIDLLIDKTLVLDIDHALIQENTISQNIQIYTDHLLDQETLDTLDLVHIPTLEIRSIRYNHKTNLNL